MQAAVSDEHRQMLTSYYLEYICTPTLPRVAARLDDRARVRQGFCGVVSGQQEQTQAHPP